MTTTTETRRAATGAQRSYGANARIGLVVPTTNTVNEAEWQALTVAGVSFHTTRMPLHGAASDDNPIAPALATALEQLTPARPTCIAYGCTAGSMRQPVESMPLAMSDATGVPCTTTAEAIVTGLFSLGVKRVAVATPYHDALNRQWYDFLTACGLEVTTIQGLGIGAGGPSEFTRIAELPQKTVREHACRSFASAPADALLLSCTDMPTLALLGELEGDLGVPVISSNTATLWRALCLSGVSACLDDGGALLRRVAPASI